MLYCVVLCGKDKQFRTTLRCVNILSYKLYLQLNMYHIQRKVRKYLGSQVIDEKDSVCYILF